MRRFIPLIVLGMAAACMAADSPSSKGQVGGGNSQAATDDGPRSGPAVEAKRKYDLECKIAKTVYVKALSAATQEYTANLDDALHAAMKAENVDEVERIHKALQDAVEAGKNPGETPIDSSWLGGTRWRFNGTAVTLSYKADGTLTCNDWAGTGWWKMADQNSINAFEPVGTGLNIHITFSSDRTAALWQYPYNKSPAQKMIIAYMVRAE